MEVKNSAIRKTRANLHYNTTICRFSVAYMQIDGIVGGTQTNPECMICLIPLYFRHKGVSNWHVEKVE